MINKHRHIVPLKACKGRVFRKIKKLYRPLIIRRKSVICNACINDKNKIRFLTQLFRWFRKDNRHYKIELFYANENKISDCDLLYLSVKIQKAGFKKLLLKLNYHIKEYKKLKRRSYSLNFAFFFIDCNNKNDKNITLDIIAKGYDIFDIFITTNSYYMTEFYYIINTFKDREIIDITS